MFTFELTSPRLRAESDAKRSQSSEVSQKTCLTKYSMQTQRPVSPFFNRTPEHGLPQLLHPSPIRVPVYVDTSLPRPARSKRPSQADLDLVSQNDRITTISQKERIHSPERASDDHRVTHYGVYDGPTAPPEGKPDEQLVNVELETMKKEDADPGQAKVLSNNEPVILCQSAAEELTKAFQASAVPRAGSGGRDDVQTEHEMIREV